MRGLLSWLFSTEHWHITVILLQNAWSDIGLDGDENPNVALNDTQNPDSEMLEVS